MGGVTVAKRLERLVRFVPGIPGYQDRETARATDKQVRMRLVGELHRLGLKYPVLIGGAAMDWRRVSCAITWRCWIT